MTGDGYVVLRWKIGVKDYVEALEHRVVAASDGRHVHHLNHDKRDNRPGNLQRLTLHEHMQRHGVENRKYDRAKAIELYEQGYGTPAIGAMLGVDGSNIYRGLARLGFTGRPRGFSTQRQRETISKSSRRWWASQTPEEREAFFARLVAKRRANGTYRLPNKVNRKAAS